jgi:hypothetical protein
MSIASYSCGEREIYGSGVLCDIYWVWYILARLEDSGRVIL